MNIDKIDDAYRYLKKGPYRGMLEKYRWLILSLLSSVLLIFTFPEPGLPLLGWIALAPLFVVIQREKFTRVVLSAVVTSVVFNIFYLWWVKEYKHPLALSGAVLAEVVFFTPAVLLSRFLFHNCALVARRRHPFGLKKHIYIEYLKPLMLPLGWIAMDYLKTIGFLAFPWGILAYSQYKNHLFIQTASIFGIWGIDLIMLYWNAVLSVLLVVLLFNKKQLIRVCVLHGLIVMLLIGVSFVFGMLKRVEEKKGFSNFRRIALIQANLDPWSPRVRENLETEMRITDRALAENPDIVVWSESSVPFYYRYHLAEGNRYAEMMHEYIVGLNKPFVFGTVDLEGERKNGRYVGDSYNVALFYNGGALKGVYRKIHLVPFGEWFPYKRLFPFVSKILENAGAGDFNPGRDYTVFHTGDLSFNVLICFEDAFGNLARRFVLGGSDLIVNITNDAWTGSPKAEVQHYVKSIFRAVENRRSLVRAANGGVTACIDPYGKELYSLPLFTTGYLVCEVPVFDKKGPVTFYTRYGDLPALVLFCAAGALFLLLLFRRALYKMGEQSRPG